MIIGLCSDFWICLCRMGALFFDFYLLSRFLESMMVVCCLFNWTSQLVCSQGMAAGVRGWGGMMN